jgi:hypothetical protein
MSRTFFMALAALSAALLAGWTQPSKAAENSKAAISGASNPISTTLPE